MKSDFSVSKYGLARIHYQTALKNAALGTGRNLLFSFVLNLSVTQSVKMPSQSVEVDLQSPKVHKQIVRHFCSHCWAKRGRPNGGGSNSIASPHFLVKLAEQGWAHRSSTAIYSEADQEGRVVEEHLTDMRAALDVHNIIDDICIISPGAPQILCTEKDC